MKNLNIFHFCKHKKVSYAFHLPQFKIVNYQFSENLGKYFIASNKSFIVDFYFSPLSENAQLEIVSSTIKNWFKLKGNNDILFVSSIFQLIDSNEILQPHPKIHFLNYASALEQIRQTNIDFKIAI